MSAPSTIRRMLTIEEVSEILNVQPSALHMQRHRSQEPGSLGFQAGKRILFDPAELEEYFDRQKAARGGDAA